MRPDRDTLLMQTAILWSERSTCSRAQVGCVIAYQGRILVQGYNGAPSGLKHCDHRCPCFGPDGIYKPPEAHHPNCGMMNPCYRSTHAEANAIAFAARNGANLYGAEIHTTLQPCLNCAMLIVNAGIDRVVYLNEYRDPAGTVLLDEAGVQNVRYVI